MSGFGHKRSFGIGAEILAWLGRLVCLKQAL